MLLRALLHGIIVVLLIVVVVVNIVADVTWKWIFGFFSDAVDFVACASQ